MVASNATGTSYTYSDSITAGETYDFRVSARNEIGSSDYSSPVSIIAATVPGAPSALVRDDSTNAS